MINNLLTDTARELFRAVSYVIHVSQLPREDEKYIIQQLCRHYLFYYLYFELLDKDRITQANQSNAKAITAKKNVITFYERKYTYYCTRPLDGIFGKDNWEHCITDGSIRYE